MVGPGLTQNFFFGKSSQNYPIPVLIFWSNRRITCVYILGSTLLKLSVVMILVLSVTGFQKKIVDIGGGWVGRVSSSILFWILDFL